MTDPEREWELQYGCHWNNSLSQYECLECGWRWAPGMEPAKGPKDWSPRKDQPLAMHEPKCPTGKALVMKKRVLRMRFTVDPALGKDEIRVPDRAVAEWLAEEAKP